ncbi:DExH-box ATP-dependent RNA helicase DExH5, mitochondrial isoform X2 [Arachis ipaensis]|uniref:DExH-box ATP-dependent RNA helicase DExH5, mitochondrial isoform X2 n=1 Tax=Arachis ipaensis TaxID=130454 RepID=UPI000A2B7DFB|nr:DExH-box ATP-dependent RNA helicase DExH5, mitochondrial isoform X2 [Arachis ipaensis]XP_025674671.1 DExH-box ATP-dependent RNA helicase DExH5, mitochondrial isoform X2 [Arachis hypogaea]
MPFIILSSSHPSLLTAKALKPSIHAMKDRPTLSSYGAIYVPPHHRLRSVITSANYNSSAPSVAKLRDHHGAALNPRPVASAAPTTVHRSQTTLPEQIPVKGNSRFVSAYDDVVSEEGSDREFEAPSFRSASPNDNVDEWMRKLTLLLNDKSKQELLSREKKDRRDFDQIALLASRMGLYSHMYAKVVVFSKVPLPNYRYDLDDRRPQREVSMPITLLRRVDAYFEEHLTRKSKMKESFSDVSFTRSSSNSSIGTDEGLFEHPEPLASSKAVGEKILRRRSLQMHDQQQAWQESPEGRRMLEFRRSLPAYKEKKAILSLLSRNQVVVISGETGCGKTTQIPQFILESEIESVRGAACNIICTQPRRISAMSVSERVAYERGEKLGESVGYKVRLEGMKGRDTHLLFCTTGILLRRLLADRNLTGVTHVIVDEIHERGMNEDFLLIVLKDLLPHRPEMKLILMSATLDSELFSSYFNGAPVMNIPGFTYPVRTHFLEDILEMTGYRLTTSNQIDDYGQERMWKMNKQVPRKRKSQIAYVVERLIFEEPKDGVRKIVLATNIAETSITINDVVFVLDCGKAKETSYDALNNTPCLLPTWISKVSAQQRRGRAGRVQPGVCYHIYPRCVYDAFAEYQLPEILRTPLQSLCLQIKSLRLGSIPEFLSRALQSPEILAVQNAIEYLKIIGALDENENLTTLGSYLTMLPMEPKLGKMLILGAIFNCLDPILTVAAGLSVRDPFLTPLDKKDLAEAAKSQFAGAYSDHLALIKAYEGWKDAELDIGGCEYCWKNFLSAQSMKAIDALRREFRCLLKDIGLVDSNTANCNLWSCDVNLIRAVICYGLYPGICAVVHNEKSFSLKTMEDGQVLLYSNSVNARETRIPYPWLLFNEKIKVNSVFLRDSTAVPDAVVLLFGGNLLKGDADGHLKMLGGYLEFFMEPPVADLYQCVKRELDDLIQRKLLFPKMSIHLYDELLSAVRLLISIDTCEGKFVFGRRVFKPAKSTVMATSHPASISRTESGPGGDNSKSQLQTLLTRAGYAAPSYKTKQLKNNQFRATVEFNGMQIMGQPCSNKKSAEKDAAAEALQWLMGGKQSGSEYISHMSKLLKKSKKDHN